MTERPSWRGPEPTGRQQSWIERERAFTRWVEQRFPEDLTLRQRTSRTARRRIGYALVPFLWIAVGNALDEDHRLFTGSPGVRPWQVALWVGAALAVVASLVVAARRRRRLASGVERVPVLDALGRDQRRELGREIRGEQPVVPGDEPALRVAAAEWVDGYGAAGTALAVFVVLLVAEVRGPGGLVGVLRLLLLAGLAAAVVTQFRAARAGEAYLSRAARDDA